MVQPRSSEGAPDSFEPDWFEELLVQLDTSLPEEQVASRLRVVRVRMPKRYRRYGDILADRGGLGHRSRRNRGRKPRQYK